MIRQWDILKINEGIDKLNSYILIFVSAQLISQTHIQWVVKSCYLSYVYDHNKNECISLVF